MDDDDVTALWSGEMEGFPASATTIPFDPPLPLLRGPVPAGLADNPTAGQFVLAFRDAAAWRSAFRATQSKMIAQCEDGVRVGCSISASSKCKPPWWKFLFGITRMDYAAREQCEEREMAACLAAAKDSCIQFANDKCLPPFREARIASDNLEGILRFVLWHNGAVENESKGTGMKSEPASFLHETSHGSLKYNVGVTNYRGSDLLDDETAENSGASPAELNMKQR